MQNRWLILGMIVAVAFSVVATNERVSSAVPAPSPLPSPNAAASHGAAASPSAVPIVSNAVAGKETFTMYCSVCHGIGAQGFIGPYIAGVNWGTSGLHTIVRVGIGGYGGMPAFNSDAVTDKDISNIVAYLATLPPNTVPVASHGPPVAGDLGNGQKLYAANCASCHGASGQGGVGPELHGENTRKDTAGTIFWIKHPILPMPTLYPKPLNEKDVTDVAAFVEKL